MQKTVVDAVTHKYGQQPHFEIPNSRIVSNTVSKESSVR